jgi:hypothetical protein
MYKRNTGYKAYHLQEVMILHVTMHIEQYVMIASSLPITISQYTCKVVKHCKLKKKEKQKRSNEINGYHYFQMPRVSSFEKNIKVSLIVSVIIILRNTSNGM